MDHILGFPKIRGPQFGHNPKCRSYNISVTSLSSLMAQCIIPVKGPIAVGSPHSAASPT